MDTRKAGDDATRLTKLMGSLVQVGYFPHGLVPIVPEQIEIAGRYAFVDPNVSRSLDLQHEISGVITYFINGNGNKLSLQLSHLIVEDPEAKQTQAAQRLWLQWDLMF